jgi:hypothetical protein
VNKKEEDFLFFECPERRRGGKRASLAALSPAKKNKNCRTIHTSLLLRFEFAFPLSTKPNGGSSLL